MLRRLVVDIGPNCRVKVVGVQVAVPPEQAALLQIGEGEVETIPLRALFAFAGRR